MTRAYLVGDNYIHFTEVTAAYEDEVRNAIYIHDNSDPNGDGDGLVFDVDMPEDDYEAETILQNETLITDYETLSTVDFQ